MRMVKASPQFAPIKEFDRFFDRAFDTPFWPAPRTGSEFVWEPVLDFSENPKEYVVRLEVPGVTRDDLDVNLENNLLTLSGKRELNRREKGEDFLWEERFEGRFTRSLRMPGAVAGDKIEAAYTDGVLTVRLPKAATPTKSKVTIK